MLKHCLTLFEIPADFAWHLSDGIDKMTKGPELLKACESCQTLIGKVTEHKILLKGAFDENSKYFKNLVGRLRREAHKDAIAGVGLGIYELAISFFVEGGAVEEIIVPKLEEKLHEVLDHCDILLKIASTASETIFVVKDKIKNDIKHINDIKTQTDDFKTLIKLADLDIIRDNILE